jgi:hypothetical protein
MNFLTIVKTAASPIIVFIVTVILFVPIMEFTYGTDKQTGAWLIGVSMICFNSIPALILHLNYLHNDKGKLLEINKSKHSITIYEGLQKIEIHFKDIDKIEKYFINSLFRLSFRSYYYYRIILRDKSSCYISRLTIEEFENKIDNLKFEFINVFYPFIKKVN